MSNDNNDGATPKPGVPLLLVEDEADLATTMTDSLEVEGYIVTRASSLAEARQQAESGLVALAVLDMRLPDGSGLEALSAIKEKNSHAEAIIVTGYASLADAIEAVNLGAFSYLQKPVAMDLLALTLKRARERQHLSGMLEQRLREVQAQAAMNLRILEDRMKLVEEKEAKSEETTKILKTAQLAGRSLDLDEVAQTIARSITFSDYTSIHVVDREGIVSRRFTHFRGMPPFETRRGLGSLSRTVMDTREEVYAPDYDQEPLRNPDVAEAGIRSVMALPLQTDGQIQGILFVNSLRPHAFDDKLDLLRLWAEIAATALRNARSHQMSEQSRKELLQLYRATELVARSSTPEGVSEEIVKSMDFSDYTAIFLSRPDGSFIQQHVHFRHGPPVKAEAHMGEVFQKVLDSRGMVYIPDYLLQPKKNPVIAEMGIRSVVAVPLTTEEATQGVLFITSLKPNAFADRLDAIRLWAGVAAVALSNARVYEAMKHAEEDWEVTFNAATTALAVVDSERRIIRANRAMASLLGVPGDKLAGQGLCLLLHGTGEPIAGCLQEKSLSSRKEETATFTEPHLGNRRLEIRCSPIFEADGSIRRALHIIRDVERPR